MKAIEILDCIMYMDLCGEDLTKIEVPAEEDEWNPQNEEWWLNEVGGAPPAPIECGLYLLLYPNDARDWLQTSTTNYLPDATIEIGDGIAYLYKLED